MDATVTGGFPRYFSDLPDPRTGNFIAHKLHDILIISLLAVICGADGWVDQRRHRDHRRHRHSA